MSINTNFWASETPSASADTGRNRLEFFSGADKLSVGKEAWTDKNGVEKRGKTVVLDLNAVRGCPAAVELLRKVVKTL